MSFKGRAKLLKTLMLLTLSGALALGGVGLFAHAAQAAPQATEPIAEQDATALMMEHLRRKASRNDPVMDQRTLQSAIDAAIAQGAERVTLTGNVYLIESLKIRGLTRPLTLEGEGYTMMFAFPARENGRHILVTEPEGFNLSLTLRNLRLEGPARGYLGGGVAVGSGVDIKLENCLLIGNKAKEGGGVYNYNNAIHLNNCILINNTAERGGGLYSYYGQILIEGVHSLLTGNTATDPESGGGAVYGHRGSFIAEDNTSFVSNRAAGLGGAVYQPGGLILVDGAQFSGNTAVSGGAIAAGENIGTIAIHNSTLSNNKATGSQDGSQGGGYGGALYRQAGGTVDITHSTLSGNTARFGGAIFTGSGEADSLWIASSHLRHNMATYDGGGLYTADRISTTYPDPVYITVSRLDYNTAGRDGGALFAPNRAAVRLAGVGFSGNTASICCVWDMAEPEPLYLTDARIYTHNILNVEASARPQEGIVDRMPNIYNNYDINFPSRVGVTFRPWGGRWNDDLAGPNRRRDPFVGEAVQPPAPPSYGDYLFGGWRVATVGHPNEGELWSFGDPVLRPMALDAVWLTPGESAKLILKPMGGIWGDGGNRNLTVDVAKNGLGYQPGTLHREGYRFVGWANQATNQRWHMNSDRIREDSVVLVARWERIEE